MDFDDFMERVWNCRGDVLTTRLAYIRFIGTEQEAYHNNIEDGVFMDIAHEKAALGYTTLTAAVRGVEHTTRGVLELPHSDERGRGIPLIAAVDVSRRHVAETRNMEPGSCLIVPGVPVEDIVVLFDKDTDLIEKIIPGHLLHRYILRLRENAFSDYGQITKNGTH
ncbi:hypothetical protein KY362_05695 [Candidatus Woesearchaeota archaeon]|nr:hypothetical protein [Candidatus Woesearchaeota archaeon]